MPKLPGPALRNCNGLLEPKSKPRALKLSTANKANSPPGRRMT